MISQKRKIGPTRRSVSGAYSFRGESSIQFESTLERDFIIRCEHFLNVLDIIPQPAQIPFISNNGQSYTYTPDFLVYYRLGDREVDNYPKPMLIEVKPETEWRKNWRKWLPKWKAAWRYAQVQGWDFHIHDESRIRDQVFQNIRFLEPYKRMQFAKEISENIVSSVKDMQQSTPDYLLAKHYYMGIYRQKGIAHLWHLVATRKLECDLSQPLSQFTELWVPDYVI